MTLGIYVRGINEDSPTAGLILKALMRMNDNDIMEANRYKQKKLRQFIGLNLPKSLNLLKSTASVCWMKVDGTLYDYDSIKTLDLQGGFSNDDNPADL